MDISQPLDLHTEINQTSRGTVKLGAGLLAFGLACLAFSLARYRPLSKGLDGESGLIYVFLIALVLVGGLLIRWGLEEKRHPERLPAFRWLGNGTPEQQWADIEADWNDTSPEDKYQAGPWYLTPHWVLYRDSTTLSTCPTTCIAWAYLKRENTSTGPKATLTLWSLDGYKIATVSPSNAIDETLLRELYRRAPWAFYDDTQERRHAWKTDRAHFLAAVHTRYQEALDGNLPPPP